MLISIAHLMAPSGLKWALSFRAVELALQGQCERNVVPDLRAVAFQRGAVKWISWCMDKMERSAAHAPLGCASFT